MAGKKLEGELKEACAKVYELDPRKFQRLVIWVYRMQKAGYRDAVLAEVLNFSYPRIKGAEDWWKYLNSLLQKAHAAVEEKECNAYKNKDITSIAEILKKFFGYQSEKSRTR